MNLLVIDTSTDEPALGLLAGQSRRFLVKEHPAEPRATRRHGRDLIPSIRELLARAGLELRALDVVAAGLGPGSYTGLRIGLTAARTLAYSTGAALLGFDSLEGWAQCAPPDATRVHVVADAQRGDVYAGDFTRAAAGAPLQALFSSRVERLSEWLRRLSGPGTVLGPGLSSSALRAGLPGDLRVMESVREQTRADLLIDLALRLWESGRRDDPASLEPNYLRRSAAEDQWEARKLRQC